MSGLSTAARRALRAAVAASADNSIPARATPPLVSQSLPASGGSPCSAWRRPPPAPGSGDPGAAGSRPASSPPPAVPRPVSRSPGSSSSPPSSTPENAARPGSGHSAAFLPEPRVRGVAVTQLFLVERLLFPRTLTQRSLAEVSLAEPRSAARLPAPGSRRPTPPERWARTPYASGTDSARSGQARAQRPVRRPEFAPQPQPATRQQLQVERQPSPPVPRQQQKKDRKAQTTWRKTNRVPHPSAYFAEGWERPDRKSVV